MSPSTSFSLLRVSGLLSIVSAVAVVACAGSDVPDRGGVGTGGTQTGSNGGSANAGTGGTDGEGGSSMSGGEGGSGMPSGGAGGTEAAGGAGGGGDDCGGAAILVSSCGAASCHGAGSALGAFAASEATLESAVGQAASATYASCGSGNLIDDADVTQGVIYDKINGASCGGSPMPLGPPLSADDLDCIEAYLESFTQ